MEGKFDTTFIPKRPLSGNPSGTVSSRRRSSLFSVIVMVVFVTVIVLTGLVFGYKFYLNKTIEHTKADLQSQLDDVDEATIENVAVISSRIVATQAILNQHEALTEFFKFLSASTVRPVRFTDFGYVTKGRDLEVTLHGTAQSFAAIAVQMDQFQSNSSLLVFKNPALSDINLDEKGNVTFSIKGTVDASAVSYRQVVTKQNQAQ
jgi:hypothetical protein